MTSIVRHFIRQDGVYLRWDGEINRPGSNCDGRESPEPLYRPLLPLCFSCSFVSGNNHKSVPGVTSFPFLPFPYFPTQHKQNFLSPTPHHHQSQPVFLSSRVLSCRSMKRPQLRNNLSQNTQNSCDSPYKRHGGEMGA